MPNVAFTREEVSDLKPRWDLIRDCIAGQSQIKKRGDVYLPRPNPSDTSEENTERYKQYKERAVYYNVTARTLKGLIGQVFAKDPTVELPATLEIMEEDADGGGVSLNQQARKALSHTLAHGRCGILVDYPKTEAATSRAELLAGEIRPTVTLFDPWDIINWRTSTIGAKKKLSLVVLSESDVVDDDGFEQKLDKYYRVLRLVGGVYWTEIWYFDDGLNDFVMEEQVMPLDASGKPWTEIPFTFIGAENNDASPDLPPLYDLAALNIAHYRNSADYEEACYICGQPTPYFTGLTEHWVKTILKGTIQLGARAAVPLPEGGSAGLLQATPNSMPKEAMDAKERQMVALGAKLVEQSTVQRTATEAGLEEASETSLLATCAKNVSSAYTAALKWASQFIGEVVETISYELNTEFDISRLASADLQAVIAAWQAGAIVEEEMRDVLRRGGIAYLDDEDYADKKETADLDLGLPIAPVMGNPVSSPPAAQKAQSEA
jgi:hypothetical protein